MSKTLIIQTHSRDCHFIQYIEDNKTVFEHDGYMIDIPTIGAKGGDDAFFAIDVETGQIKNWNAEKVIAALNTHKESAQ